MKERLVSQALIRGVRQADLDEWMENETLVDFEVDNLIQRMIKENVISEAKGYTEISSMLEEKKKRRTEAELD